MKTRDELEAISLKLHWHLEHVETRQAIQLLDDLHSEGMRDAAAMVQKSSRLNENATEGNRVADILKYQAEIILAAIENKPKL